MQYLLLIYAEKDAGPAYGTPEFKGLMEEYYAFNADLQENGVSKGGNALQDVETATCVRVRHDKTEFVDGPFAETKEQLAGYYLVDCKDLDEALKYAAKIPTAAFGTIEVRPVMVFS